MITRYYMICRCATKKLLTYSLLILFIASLVIIRTQFLGDHLQNGSPYAIVLSVCSDCNIGIL